MICGKCGCRFASFPEIDFDCLQGYDPLYGSTIEFVPKNKEAERKRRTMFESNERGICDECLDECSMEDSYIPYNLYKNNISI